MDTSVNSLLRTLSLEEKAGQMLLCYHSPFAFLQEHHIGGVLIMQSMVKKPDLLRAELRATQKKLSIPLLVTIDQEGGTVNRLSSVNGLEKTPSAKVLQSWPPDSIRAYARRTAVELKSLGINMNLAPVLDPAVNAARQTTYMEQTRRSFGNGVTAIVPPAQAFAEGCGDEGILCVAKHFPGYDVTTNSDLELAHSDTDSQSVAEYARTFHSMAPFIAGIMMSSIHYRAFCDAPAVFSPAMVSLARGAIGEKIIMTDDLWGAALRSFIRPCTMQSSAAYPDSCFARLVTLALYAGNDMLMITFPQKVPLMIKTMAALAEKDEKVRLQIDESVRRILITKKTLGLLKTPE